MTSGLKVALVESLDLNRSKRTDWSPDAYSNRCVSLTPASESHLKGSPIQEYSLQGDFLTNRRNWGMGSCQDRSGSTVSGDASLGWINRRSYLF